MRYPANVLGGKAPSSLADRCHSLSSLHLPLAALASLPLISQKSKIFASFSQEKPFGVILQRTDGTTTYSYVYNGSQLTAMTVGENTLYFSYDAAGIPMSVSFNGTEYFYTSNIQGDVTGIVNNQGQTVVTYAYDAWGNILSCTGSEATTLGSLNPLRYRGYVYDQETGLYYLQSRYYNPAIGRFINADALVTTGQKFSGNNMFAYCLNCPVMYGDFIGLDAIILLDTDGFTHIGIMVEDEEGNWWHFYWGAANAAHGSASLLSFNVKPRTWCKQYEGELTISAINNSGQWSGNYERKMYLSGDFSSCVDEMKSIDGMYNLYERNCSQVSLGVLSIADTKYTDTLNAAKNRVVPGMAFVYMKENTPRNGGPFSSIFNKVKELIANRAVN